MVWKKIYQLALKANKENKSEIAHQIMELFSEAEESQYFDITIVSGTIDEGKFQKALDKIEFYIDMEERSFIF